LVSPESAIGFKGYLNENRNPSPQHEREHKGAPPNRATLELILPNVSVFRDAETGECDEKTRKRRLFEIFVDGNAFVVNALACRKIQKHMRMTATAKRKQT
jgi:hypothetical protein